MRRLFAFIALLALAFLTTSLAPSAGAAGNVHRFAHSSANDPGQVHLVTSELGRQIEAGQMTPQEMSDAGITPGTAPADGSAPPTEVVVPAGQIAVPDTHYGCTGDACIYVTGTGLHVSDWDTSAYSPRDICTYSIYLRNNAILTVGNWICGEANSDYWAYLKPNQDYKNNSQLCNYWYGIDGKPCATVHK